MATCEKLEKSRVRLNIEVSAEKFDEALQAAFIKTRGRYPVPGFRKGKAPRKVIENMYGEGVFFNDAFDIVYDDAYKAAVDESGVEPVGTPDISIDQIEKGSPLKFNAEVDVYPEVTLGEYKGIEVVKREYTVEDDLVDSLIEKEREKVVRYVDQDRPIEEGDQVTLDYSGSVDGVKFDGGTAEKYELTIGSHTFIPGFEEQLIGISKGESKDITVTFPEEYHSEMLAGKEAVFSVLIHEIQKKELPELDDDFAQDVSEFDTLEELRADKRAGLEKRNLERAKNEMENEAVRKAVENAEFEIPGSMINRQAEQLMRDMQYRLAMSGISLEQYCQYTGLDISKLRDDYKDAAAERVSAHLVLEAIAKAEGIEPSDEDMEAEIVRYCEQSKLDVEEFKKNIESNEREYFAERISLDKAVNAIMDNCVYVEAPEAEEAPEQKSEDKAEKKPAQKTAKKAKSADGGEDKPKKKPAKKAAAEAKEKEPEAVKE